MQKVVKKLTRRQLTIRMLGLFFMFGSFGAIVLLQIFNELNLVTAGLCVGLFIIGLIILHSAEAWLDAIEGFIFGL